MARGKQAMGALNAERIIIIVEFLIIVGLIAYIVTDTPEPVVQPEPETIIIREEVEVPAQEEVVEESAPETEPEEEPNVVHTGVFVGMTDTQAIEVIGSDPANGNIHKGGIGFTTYRLQWGEEELGDEETSIDPNLCEYSLHLDVKCEYPKPEGQDNYRREFYEDFKNQNDIECTVENILCSQESPK